MLVCTYSLSNIILWLTPPFEQIRTYAETKDDAEESAERDDDCLAGGRMGVEGEIVVNLKVVAPLIEIQVAAAPLHLAALKIYDLGTEIILLWKQRLAKIGVEHQPVGVNTAEIKPAAAVVIAIGRAISHVHGYPAIRRQIDFTPVVHVYLAPYGWVPMDVTYGATDCND